MFGSFKIVITMREIIIVENNQEVRYSTDEGVDQKFLEEKGYVKIGSKEYNGKKIPVYQMRTD